MPYGTIKVDTITFTAGGADTSVSISGLVQNPTFTGNITSTGTISGNVIQGGTTVSGATVTGTTANFVTVSGATVTGTAARFTNITGTTVVGTTTISGATVTGTAARFTNITGTTVVGTTTISGATVTGNTGQFTTLTGGTAGFTTVTGTTVTGTTANFVTVSGTTVTGTTASFTSGNFTNISGGTHTITSGVFASGTAAAPSITFTGDLDTGIFNSAANQVSITTSGTEWLRVDGTGQIEAVSLGTQGAPTYSFTTDPNTGIYSPGADQLAISTNGTGRLFVDSSGRLLVGTSSAPTGTLSQYSRFSVYLNNLSTSAGAQLNLVGGARALLNTGNALGQLIFTDSTDGEYGLIKCEVDSTQGANDYPGRLVFSTTADGASSPTERLRITSAGLVGIGTSSPSETFHVSGNARANNFLSQGYFAGQGNLTTGDARSGVTGIGPSSVAAPSDFYGAYSYFYGATHSTRPGDIEFGTGLNTSGVIQFKVNGTERLRITSTGLVGVGTSSPSRLFAISDTNPAATIRSTTTTGQCTLFFGDSDSDARGAVTYENNGDALGLWTSGGEKVRIDSSGRLGVGNTAPGSALTVSTIGSVLSGTGNTYGFYINPVSTGYVYLDALTGSTSNTSIVIRTYNNGTYNNVIQSISGNETTFSTAGNERARIDSSGRLLVGTSSAQGQSIFQAVGNSSASTDPGDIRVIRGLNVSGIGTNVGAELGIIRFGALENSVCAQISAVCDANWSANDFPGRLVFSTTADGGSSPTERMRINNNGNILIGKTSTAFNTGGTTIYGTQFPGAIDTVRDGGYLLACNRLSTDGNLIEFYQDGALEGTISVSGTTVSYNGAHLSRYSQLLSDQERIEILRGTVLSNIDEMCEWGEEENEQLNRMKVSDVEGDKNVSGVFQAWDDDDDTYTNDFYCAMTGDFIIRIAEGVTVERGDLLMSAGDGTAKPQDDDIIRSKTVAKVTSTNVTCTYEDGSYCVPCVLMAC